MRVFIQTELLQMPGRKVLKQALKMIGMTSVLLLPICASANSTITANSCSQVDVVTALGSVSTDYTTVLIPAGTCTWGATAAFSSGNASVSATGAVSYRPTFHVVIQGFGNPTGATTDGLNNPTGYNDQTIIQDNVNGTGFGRMLHITTASGKSFRMTGITFVTASGQGVSSNGGVIGIDGASHSVRIDHNHFSWTIGPQGVAYNGTVQGVIDHNYSQSSKNVNQIEVKGQGWNGLSESAGGDQSWADSSYFGTSQFMFVENNTFSGQHAFDCEMGGRIVFRYNTSISSPLQTHGTGFDSRDRGCRAMEVYGNVDGSGGGFAFWIMLESGSSLWWNNTVSGYQNFGEVDTVRTNNNTYGQGTPPNGWGYCGVHANGSTSVWDENLSNDGHKCMDGVGAGKGDLLTGGNGGSFSGTVDSVTGTQTWPNQAADPMYSWGNTVSVTNYYWYNWPGDTTTAQNREYYLELPNLNNSAIFNGTAGIGCGPSSGTGCANPVAQPSTCTPGVGYWQPANSTLYVCAAGNVWNAYYTPYAYPHPLDTGLTTTPPAPPTNLKAIAN
jgi:hypothetical protein